MPSDSVIVMAQVTGEAWRSVARRPVRSARYVTCLLLIGLLLPLLTACGAITNGVTSVVSGGGILHLSGTPPETLDPALAQDVVSWGYLLEIYSGLVRLDSNLQVQPDLASSWSVGNGGRTYTFVLRDDARFQDGRPITASDVKFSLERTLDPATHSPVASTYLGDIVGAQDRLQGRANDVSGIVVIDPRTIQITIDAPKSFFLSKLTYPTAFVVDRANVESGPTWWQHPNGSGPFALRSFDRNSKLVLVRNPRYYRTKPSLAEIDYLFGPPSPIAMYEAGQLEVATVGVGDIPWVSDPANPLHAQLVMTPQLSLSYLGFNVRQKPFDDPKVRLAFAYATDKRALSNALFRGTRPIAKGILPPGLDGYDPSFAGIPFDPDRAKQLIAESSYGSVAALPPIVLSTGGGSGQIGEVFARMYHATLGVDIAVVQLQNTFFDDLAQHRVQMFYLGWSADYPDPQDFLDILFSGGSEANNTGYDNPEVNRLLAQAAIEPDHQRRIALYREAEQRIVSDAPVIPLFNDTEYDLVSPRVTGLRITPLGIVSFDGVRVRS